MSTPKKTLKRFQNLSVPGALEPYRFNGPEYVPSRDGARLTGQLKRIFDLMKDGKWRSYNAIAEITGDPSPSISAQLRHLRKPRFGSYIRWSADTWAVDSTSIESAF